MRKWVHAKAQTQIAGGCESNAAHWKGASLSALGGYK